eukprot:Sspe_Gene.12973::Locus_4441_Transcript_2_3_Confidence_0.333_Length_2096::g.12973::m.12973/K01049/ACHE; acetylcholinesterase
MMLAILLMFTACLAAVADESRCAERLETMCASPEYCGNTTEFGGCPTPDKCSSCAVRFLETVMYSCSGGIDEINSQCKVPPPQNTPVTVEIPSLGAVEGFVPPNAMHSYFRGIPYAAPPVGDLRLRPPQPVSPWKGTLNATKFKDACTQLGPAWASEQLVQESSEDCLYLNIYAPRKKAQGKGYPVMVYIPAGQFLWGTSDDLENYEPGHIKAAEEVVYVTVNYRLGALGFLALDELRKRSSDNSTGNYGIQDQRAAFEWLRKNIQHFGGDPSNIVLWGESAGGTAVSVHLVLPKSRGVFDKAIIESAAFNRWTYKTYDTAVANAKQVVQNLWAAAKGNTTLCPGITGDDAVQCLLRASARDIVYYSDDAFGHASSSPYMLPYGDTIDKCGWAPVIDGVEMTRSPVAMLEAGEVAKVPVILGYNRDEGSTFTAYQTGHGDNVSTSESMYHRWVNRSNFTTSEDYVSWATEIWGAAAAEELRVLYSPNPPAIEDWWWAMAHTIGDYALSCPTRRAAELLAAGGATPFLYYFNHTPAVSINNRDTAEIGAFHGSEVPFVWYDDFELVLPSERNLSQAMVGYWNSFAAVGEPSVRGLPDWPRFTATSDISIVFGDRADGAAQHGNVTFVTQSKKTLCSYWNRFL